MNYFNIDYRDLAVNKREGIKETVEERIREDEETMEDLKEMALEVHESGSNGGMTLEERIDMAVENEAEEQIRKHFSASGEV